MGEREDEERERSARQSAETMVAETPLGPSGALLRGAAIGRYLVLSLLGRGGMGEVHAAYDPELDRRVAIKLLYTASDTEDAKRRLLREARALGKLSHPNVVQVYDAGEHEENVFVAMELVEGAPLDAFCKGDPRPGWQAVVAAYLDAARGLAAAHEKGLIHRDVKPANMLRGKDGRVRVADFGIAKGQEDDGHESGAVALPAGDAVAADETLPAPSVPASLPQHRLTQTGVLMGTPLYLAPEQHEGRVASPASDQYSLCVALYEGLYGSPPFTTDTIAGLRAMLAELYKKKRGGAPATPPAGSDVPAWVHAAVVRGLAPKPEDRHPSIDALIAALSHDPAASRRAWVRGAAVLAGALSLFAIAVAGWVRSSATADPCADQERALAGAWDEGVKDRIRSAFQSSGRPGAEGTAARVVALLDGHAAGWARMRGEVCRASRAAPQRTPILGLREECLDRRRAQLGALAALFAEKPDPEIVDKAVQAASALYPIGYCADTEALTARVRPPEDPAVRARVAALEPRMDRLEALYTAGKYADGLSFGEPLLAEAASLPYAPLRAHAQYVMSRLRDGTGDYEGAKGLLREAAASASEGRDDVLGATAWARLLFIVGERQRRFEEASVIRALGPTALSRVRDDRVLSTWLNAEGLLLYRMGKYPEAKATHQRALALREKALGQGHLDVAISLNNLGLVLTDMGDPAGAKAALSAAISIREKALGPEHPEVALCLHNLGIAFAMMGDSAEAKAAYERALAVQEKALGPEHPEVVMSLNSLGLLSVDARDGAAAKAFFGRALSAGEKALGPNHPRVAESMTGLGRAEVLLGRFDEGRALLERALALHEKAEGRDHPTIADTLIGLGDAEVARGKPDLALPLFERALLLGGETTEVQLPLADILYSKGKDRARARLLVTQLRAYYERIGKRPGVETASRWLAAHP